MNHAEILAFLNYDYPDGLYFLAENESFLAWPLPSDADIIKQAQTFAEANPEAIFVTVERVPAGDSKKTIIAGRDPKGENERGLQVLARHLNLRLATQDGEPSVLTLEIPGTNPSATPKPELR